MIGQPDIIVVGSGAAGIAAAVAAARRGQATLLLDQHSEAGGTGGLSGLTTLCGLYDDKGNFLNEGFPREFAEAVSTAAMLQMGKVWVLPYQPEKFRQVATTLLRETPNLQTSWNAPVASVIVKEDRIVAINGIQAGAVIDCTGKAAVASAVGAECLETTEATQSPAVIFPLRNVERDLSTPAAVAQVLLPLARAGFPPLSFQPSLEPETVVVKFTGQPAQAGQVIDFLRSQIEGFESCFTPLTEFAVASRAGRMIVGRYILTGEDVVTGRKFPDAVARCAWPIEQWGPDGVARFRYLSGGGHYEIPARSLRAAGIENLFMAGKTISADVDAIASARVMGCCLATGEAAGNLAADYLEFASSQ